METGRGERRRSLSNPANEAVRRLLNLAVRPETVRSRPRRSTRDGLRSPSHANELRRRARPSRRASSAHWMVPRGEAWGLLAARGLVSLKVPRLLGPTDGRTEIAADRRRGRHLDPLRA